MEKENTACRRERSVNRNLRPRIDNIEADHLLEKDLTHPKTVVHLTKREREVLEFVLAGKTNREIAQQLFRTERTVEYHRNRLMRKIGAHSIVDLVKYAISAGVA